MRRREGKGGMGQGGEGRDRAVFKGGYGFNPSTC